MKRTLLFCILWLPAIIICAQNPGIITGQLASPELKEISGMAPSAIHPGIFYVHNDSGDAARFFAITTKGELLATYYFTAKNQRHVSVRDCEDIAAGPGPEKGASYIYLADIGDNIGWRNAVKLYRFREPSLSKAIDTIEATVFTLQYPDGSRDAETLMIDPVDSMIYILSKREDSVGIYRLQLNSNNNKTIILERCGKLFFPGHKSDKWVVAGDISANGSAVLIKTNTAVYYFKRSGTEPIYKTLQQTPIKQKQFSPHGQQEAIAFAADNKGYYVMAEGRFTPIYYFPLEE